MCLLCNLDVFGEPQWSRREYLRYFIGEHCKRRGSSGATLRNSTWSSVRNITPLRGISVDYKFELDVLFVIWKCM